MAGGGGQVGEGGRLTSGMMLCFRVEAARVNLGRRRNNSFLGEKTVLLCSASRLTRFAV